MSYNDKFNGTPNLIFQEPVEIRLSRAKNPNSSPALLEVLSKDSFWFVRDMVALNINTPSECLERLRKDSDFRIRVDASNTLEKQRLKRECSEPSLQDTILKAEALKKSSSETNKLIFKFKNKENDL